MLRFIMISSFALLLIAAPAAAQTITEIQPLRFGAVALRDNARPFSLTVAPDNTVTADSAYVQGPVPAQRGEYLLEGYPPNTALRVSMANGMLSGDRGRGQRFSITDYTSNSLTTDAAGTATLYIGATLQTSGNRESYGSGSYHGTLDIIIDVE